MADSLDSGFSVYSSLTLCRFGSYVKKSERMENYRMNVGVQSIIFGVINLSISARNGISDCIACLEMEIGFICSLIFRIEL